MTQAVTRMESGLHLQALEQAREAVVRLETLKAFLTPEDKETLSILIDKKLMALLGKSLTEAKKGKLVPLKSIL